jgi:hypothetical protein
MGVLDFVERCSVDRLEQLIVCTLDLIGDRPVGAVELTKHLYLVDVQAIRTLGRPITGVAWQRHQNGPFTKDVYDARDRLRSQGLITMDEVPTAHSTLKQEHRLVPGVMEKLSIEFDDCEYAVIHATVTKNSDHDWKALERMAKATEPMLIVQDAEKAAGVNMLKGVVLDMASVQPSPFSIAD